jgi:hypothetical protein
MSEKCNKLYMSIMNSAYRDTSIIKRIKVFVHIRGCNSCKTLYNEHVKIASSLHHIGELECPDSVINKVEKIVGKSNEETSFLFDFYSVFTRFSAKTIATSAVIILIAIVMAFFYRQGLQKSETINYPQAEVEKANLQAQQALVLIGKVLNSTQVKLKAEILPSRVAKPLNKSLGMINDLFKSGDKNEKN